MNDLKAGERNDATASSLCKFCGADTGAKTVGELWEMHGHCKDPICVAQCQQHPAEQETVRAFAERVFGENAGIKEFWSVTVDDLESVINAAIDEYVSLSPRPIPAIETDAIKLLREGNLKSRQSLTVMP